MPPFAMANYRWLALVAMGSFGVLCLLFALLTVLFARRSQWGPLSARTLLVGGVINIALGVLFFLTNYNGTVSS